MGFDLYGVAPAGKGGEYFRNNVWYWHPLWEFVCETCKDILTEEDKRGGTFNEGYRIGARKAQKIYDRLIDLLDNTRHVREYEALRNATLDSLPDRECEWCKGSGTRDDEHVKGKCNACEGRGTVRPWATHYPFTEENLREFVGFLKDCGGFEVC